MADNDKFEQKLSRMEEISKALSDPETDLQKAVDLYEEGMKLANEVDTELSKIERRIEIVTSRPGESPDGVLTEEYKQSSDF
ncbi:MAG: exodeoxyribonuclease VII small subunit [Spirochaetales bacterium]|nr:exodeoxyribonuclease VII small subunit [Spirochaetales bacterium]MBQ7643553.1 exodeoxyribonuclease VII small subunit [Spirochaetales bacterium]